ncbi:MAG: 3-phosphoshikimate 1-carboxyvinyltransferase [Thermoplasmata archaeon]
MTLRSVSPASLSGSLRAPPSKSYTHRGLISGFLSQRSYRVDHPLEADDTRATATGLELLGSVIRRSSSHWSLTPVTPTLHPNQTIRLRCGQSGTTLRFLTAVAARQGRLVRVEGDPRLARRPLRPLLRVLRSGGVRIRRIGAPANLPLEILGPLRGVRTSLHVGESSQFLSALLFVLPTLETSSSLQLVGTPVSQEYVAATLRVLSLHRVRVSLTPSVLEVEGGQQYRGAGFRVPGDASSAAYWWAAAGLNGGPIRVRGVPLDWPQADLEILPILEAMGSHVARHSDGATVEGRIREPFDVDLTNAPDLYPLVGSLAAQLPGTSVIRGAPHVVAKESDRRAATIRLVRGLGGTARLTRRGLEVRGTHSPRPLRSSLSDDHRVVMASAIAATAASGPSLVGSAEAVRKSYPTFWDDLRSLGGTTKVAR